jgi:hypothetical protein
MGIRKYNFAFLFILLCLTGLVSAEVKVDGEPPVAEGEVPVLLGGMEGCVVAPPKGNCLARIKCAGVGKIFGSSAFAVRNATKAAQSNARSMLARFYSEKAYTEDSVKQAVADMSQTNASGGEDSKTMESRTIDSFEKTTAEAVLSGFQILGREIDMEQKTVTIKGGVSCKSQAAAAQSQAASAKSATQSVGSKQSGVKTSTKSGAAAQSSGPVNFDKVRQKVKDVDDF